MILQNYQGFSVNSLRPRDDYMYTNRVILYVTSRYNGPRCNVTWFYQLIEADDILECISWMNENVIISIQILLIFFQCTHWQYISIGSEDNLALKRLQAIIWTSDSLVDVYMSLGFDE